MAANRPKFKSSLAASLEKTEDEPSRSKLSRGQGKDDEHRVKPKRMVYAPKKDPTLEAPLPSRKFHSSLASSGDTETEPKAAEVANDTSAPVKAPFKSSLAAKIDDSKRSEEKRPEPKPARFKSSLNASLEAKPAHNEHPRSQSFKGRDRSAERHRGPGSHERQVSSSSNESKKGSILSRVGPKAEDSNHSRDRGPQRSAPRGSIDETHHHRDLRRSTSRSSMDETHPRRDLPRSTSRGSMDETHPRHRDLRRSASRSSIDEHSHHRDHPRSVSKGLADDHPHSNRRDRSNSGRRDSDPLRRQDTPPPAPQSLSRKSSFEQRGPTLQRHASSGSSLQRQASDVRKVTMTPTRSVDDDAERRRAAAESLRARFEARGRERAPDKPKGESPAEREKRTNEYYAKLNEEKPSKPRTEPFKSSLMQSMKSSLSSSLALSIAREPTQRLEKIRYTLQELQSLNRDFPRPADLGDMTVITLPPSPKTLARSAKAFAAKERGPIRRGAPRSQRGEAGGGRGGRDREYGGKKGGKGRRGKETPMPPLLDGPFEPLVKSEKRWVPSKEKAGVAATESVASVVKSLLNKLTRELFEKLTKSFCEIPLSDFGVLRTMITLIMDKALEEPNFAEVYADLCARLHAHTAALGKYKFLHPVQHAGASTWSWTAISSPSFPAFYGPYETIEACMSAAEPTSPPTPLDQLDVPSFYCTETHLLAVATKRIGAGYFVSAKLRASLTEDELLVGSFATAEAAVKAAVSCTTFKRLLVTRCQDEFDKWNVADKTQAAPATEEERLRANIAAKRAKARMLGNMRFIGELFKVELLAEHVVQTCLLKLLGLRLVTTEAQGLALQTIRMPDEEELEALCKMLATVGKKFDHAGVKTVMNGIIVRLVELSETPSLPSRTRFLLKDLLETRDYQWVPRRKELQQKTLEEVRKEAEKLQRLGKNAQHDDLVGKRKKTAHSSDQLAKQNSTLLLRAPAPLSPAAASSRIKGIVKEYLSARDADETRLCLQELPRSAHVEFVETALTTALEGKEAERAAAVDMLAALYETLDLGATEIQSALLNTLEFLDDLRIDIPMVHEYCAAVLGRLIVAGCFGLSWLQSVVGHLVDSGLAGLLLAEVLSVLEEESSLESVCAMVVREEVSVAAFLPEGASVEAYLKEQEIDMYFYDDEDDEEDEDDGLWQRLQLTVDEYVVVQDLNEVEACLKDLGPAEKLHPILIKVVLNMLCECKAPHRPVLVGLLQGLWECQTLSADDFSSALEWWLSSVFEDAEIDVPQAATYVAPVPAFLLASGGLSLQWLASTMSPLVRGVPSGLTAKFLHATLLELDGTVGQDATVNLVAGSGVTMIDVAQKPEDADKLTSWFR
ncbi:eukaryotic translation initiation factor 4 gamma 2 [Achlya hypogyna]|uniref:Eukaryotic translation initiation factor 4 gamma 2 n=1 Tax=Achlya hypogyna TaxID=1202772 RepID=A0A1V9YJV3_ACHHY|nr:eukaryotic translation initiation factor 4 gamma 2 [Achlya hypogyna]